MKAIFIFGLSTLLFLSFTKSDKDISAKLLDIEYYSKCDCSDKSPVLVRVTYSVDCKDLKSLKMKHIFSNGVTITSLISETDKKGNIVYNFCTGTDKKKEFSTIFVGIDGNKSNNINVRADILSADVIEGTAPETIKIN